MSHSRAFHVGFVITSCGVVPQDMFMTQTATIGRAFAGNDPP